MDLILGVDIGGTTTKIGVVREDGVILSQAAVIMCANSEPADFVKRLVRQVEGLMTTSPKSYHLPRHLRAVGVGAPNGSFYSRKIEYVPNLQWSGIVPIASMIEERLKIPTFVTNDANAAAAISGDALALEIFEDTGRLFGEQLAVILGGAALAWNAMAH